VSPNNKISDSFRALDAIVLSICGVGSVLYAAFETRPLFWAPFWGILCLLFIFAVYRDWDSHWPSTLFGIVEIAYIGGVLLILHDRGVQSEVFTQAICGLLFVHTLLYMIAVKRCLKFSDGLSD